MFHFILVFFEINNTRRTSFIFASIVIMSATNNNDYLFKSVSTRNDDGSLRVICMDRTYGFKPVVYVTFTTSTDNHCVIPFNLCEEELAMRGGREFVHFTSKYATMKFHADRAGFMTITLTASDSTEPEKICVDFTNPEVQNQLKAVVDCEALMSDKTTTCENEAYIVANGLSGPMQPNVYFYYCEAGKCFKWDHGVGKQTFPMLRSRGKVALKEIKVTLSEETKYAIPGRPCALASPTVFVDTELRTVYVLVNNGPFAYNKDGKPRVIDDDSDDDNNTLGHIRCKVHAVTYFHEDLRYEHANEDVVSFEWVREAIGEFLNVTITNPHNEGVVFRTDICGTFFFVPPLVSPALSSSIVPSMFEARKQCTYNFPEHVLLGTFTEDMKYISCGTFGNYDTFQSVADVRKCLETYFEFLHLLDMGEDNWEDPRACDTFRQHWKDQMRYGFIRRWDLSELKDLNGLFADFVFPFRVRELDLRSWKFSEYIQSTEKMFYNVSNLQTVLLPKLFFDVPHTLAEKGGIANHVNLESMFAHSSVERISLGMKVSGDPGYIMLGGMFEGCQVLESINLGITYQGSELYKNQNTYMNDFASKCPVLWSCHVDMTREKLSNVKAVVVQASSAFQGCGELTDLAFTGNMPMSADAIGHFISYTQMLSGCHKLPNAAVANVFCRLRFFEILRPPLPTSFVPEVHARSLLHETGRDVKDNDVLTMNMGDYDPEFRMNPTDVAKVLRVMTSSSKIFVIVTPSS